jgi:hypothetical protein
MEANGDFMALISKLAATYWDSKYFNLSLRTNVVKDNDGLRI